MLNDFQLTQKSYFKWFQLLDAISKSLAALMIKKLQKYHISNLHVPI